ncbi:DUF1080 domain-containing protein [Flaviaesturariibacter amylovorans]|uniref:DUF1080 domain-containing protein n=1 Tax=Flaviaesturariibacter amylovorans TaxID=1084520 RepID=A0ABP8GKI7_9BACT
MTHLTQVLFPLLLAAGLPGCRPAQPHAMTTDSTSSLSAEERQAGFRPLFDGRTTTGWHSYGRMEAGGAWKVADGTLHLDPRAAQNGKPLPGGDLVSAGTFANFDLRLEWKIAAGGNSGIMFYVQEDSARYAYPWQTGPEMQVLDNERHPDGKIRSHRAGDLYDLVVAQEAARPPGEWNEARIVAHNGDLQFFLNGIAVLRTTLWSDKWRRLVAGSKFRDMPGFGTFRSGRIALQDHGDPVWFRNIRIRTL